MRTDLVSSVLLLLHCMKCLSPHQLSDVTDGLNYLHSSNVIHGDLKGVRDYSRSHFTTIFTPSQSAVLVDATGRARIMGFGLPVVTQSLDSIRSAPAGCGHSARWIAPEVLDGQGIFSKEGDIFSFAMVVIEVRCR